MYREDLVLNNLQWLIRRKTQPDQTNPNSIYLIGMYVCMYKDYLVLNNLQ